MANLSAKLAAMWAKRQKLKRQKRAYAHLDIRRRRLVRRMRNCGKPQ